MEEKLIMRKETLLNEGYLQNWTLYEAAKEFTQNYVFALQHLNVKGKTYYNNETKTAIWEDYGKGFDLSCLLMGIGQQRQIENAPGENGEGMKISLLIACREGKSCIIEIPNYTIIPKLEAGQFGANELVLYVYENKRTIGTKFELECSKGIYDKAIESFGFLTSEEDKYKFNESSIINDGGKNLYINGVKINTNMKMLFSYNLIGKSLANRDRNAIDPSEINFEIWKQIFSKLRDKDIIKFILQNMNNNTIETHYSYPYLIDLELWKECARELYGDKVCYCIGDKSDNRARYHRFKTIKTPVDGMINLCYNLNIKSSLEISPDKKPKQRLIQLKDLTMEERDNVNSVRKLIQKHYCDKIWNLRYVDGLKDEYGNYLNGLCHYNEELIYLDLGILQNWDTLFEVLLHETVHQVSKAEDLSEEFEQEWGKACLAFAKGCRRAKRA